MIFSFAPMEGITGYVYRTVHHECFPGVDVYYSPFIAPDGGGNFRRSMLRDVLPENNPGYKLIPQILCNSPDAFLKAAVVLKEMGYSEINLNAGCPSGTVVSKHKGAGMLSDLSGLDRCLEGIFSGFEGEVSIKTRMGMESCEEFPAILDIYRKYPIKRLIIHARARTGMYKARPDLEAYLRALKDCPFPVEYNGDIFTKEGYNALLPKLGSTDGVMIGRGAVADPALFREIQGGAVLSPNELKLFHDTLADRYEALGYTNAVLLAKMKELWFYMQTMFFDSDRLIKGIYKSKDTSSYKSAADALFSYGKFDPAAGFHQ